MKLHITGEANVYYVQTLCMIFFPGEKFSGEEDAANEPELFLDVSEGEDEIVAAVRLTLGEKVTTATRGAAITEGRTLDRTRKIAIGYAVLEAAGEMLHYRPSWGMLTGVRPSKIATELLLGGLSPARVRRALTTEYMVIPKKATLATAVAMREMEIIGQPDPRDCSIYVSVPFCPTRCSYCSFVSYTSKRLLSLIPDYLTMLCDEIEKKCGAVRALGLNIKSLYIGGGTPTILDAAQLKTLLSTIARNVDVASLKEFTLESGRPDTIDAEKMAIAAAYGVTRVCVNPQTLCDEILTGVGRRHTAEDFYRAYDIARNSGIKCINTDLIVGLPGDTFDTFFDTYNQIISLDPENITVHTFCVKRAAEILRQGKRAYNLRGGDAGKCVDYSQIRAGEAGYLPYYMYRQKNMVGNFENVGFAKPGFECLYNIYMMEEVHSIFAVGAGAVLKLVDYAPAGTGKKSTICRLFNPKYPYEYLRSDGGTEQTEQIFRFYRERGF